MVLANVFALCGIISDIAGYDGLIQPTEVKMPFAVLDDSNVVLMQFKISIPQLFRGELPAQRLRSFSEAYPRTAKSLRLPQWNWEYVPQTAVYQWRIGNDFLWVASAMYPRNRILPRGYFRLPFPVETHPANGGSGEVLAGERPARPPLPSGYEYNWDSGKYADGGELPISGENRLFRIASFEMLFDIYISHENRDRRLRMEFDILPTAPQKAVMLIVVDGNLSIWDYAFSRGQYMASRPDIGIVGLWQRRATLKAPCAGPFRIALSDGAYFMISDSGSVYRIEGEKDIWKCEECWKREPKPIVAMLAMSDNTGAYVFGKDFYFKLGKKLDVKPCRDVTQHVAKETNKDLEKLEPAARLAYECGRVLYEKGELKPAEKWK